MSLVVEERKKKRTEGRKDRGRKEMRPRGSYDVFLGI